MCSSHPDLFIKFYKQYLKKYPNFGAYDKMSANEWWSYVVKDCFQTVDPTLKEEKLQKISNELFVHYMKSEAWEFLPGAVDAIKVSSHVFILKAEDVV